MKTLKSFTKSELKKMNEYQLRKHYENFKKKSKSYLELLEIILEEKKDDSQE